MFLTPVAPYKLWVDELCFCNLSQEAVGEVRMRLHQNFGALRPLYNLCYIDSQWSIATVYEVWVVECDLFVLEY